MQAMGLFFAPRGPGQGGAIQELGQCSCGGLLRMVTDPELEPVRPEISCSLATAQGCNAGLGSMPITSTFREFQVRALILVLLQLKPKPSALLLINPRRLAFVHDRRACGSTALHRCFPAGWQV